VLEFIVKRLMASLFCWLALAACTKKENNLLRQPAHFGKVYAHILYATRISASDSSAVRPDSAWRRSRIDSVLASRKLTRTQLDDAVQFFSADPQRWREVYQNVVSEFDSLSFARQYSPRKISPQN
jgi:hypothetical protein